MMLLHCLLLFTTCVATLIPREKLISESSYSSISLSPDGKNVGYIAPDNNKIKNVFILRIEDRVVRQVTFEGKDVDHFHWTSISDVIIFRQDRSGDENWMLFKKNFSETAPTNERIVVFDKPNVQAKIVGNNLRDNYVLISINDETPEYHNVYKFHLITNQLTLVFKNNRFAPDFIIDNDMKIRLVKEEQEDGSLLYFRTSAKANDVEVLTSDGEYWEEYAHVLSDDVTITEFHGFDETNEMTYWIWGENTNLGSLIVAPFHNFSQKAVLYSAKRAKIVDVLFHPQKRTLLAHSEYYHKPELVYIDESIAADVEILSNLWHEGSFHIERIAQDMNTWLISYDNSQYFVYHRSQNKIDFLFFINPELEGYPLYKQIGFNFTARDGLAIQGYISLPPSALLKNFSTTMVDGTEHAMIPMVPQKMVLLVHGGPDDRDTYHFDTEVALLTSRGYAVMQVNFRGSTGFGKKLYNEGNGEWSKKMHNDLIDAVEFAIAKGIANRSEIAIMGTSYGGYSALVGITFTPDTFVCGVDIVGPSNLITLIESLPPYWKGERKRITNMVGGDIYTEKDINELIERSPLFLADRVKKPLLVIQGANDVRVKQRESDQFVEALKNNSIPVTYVLYTDEGHHIRRTPNVLAKFGYVEKFLHQCLGGEYQAFDSGQYNESAVIEMDDFAS